MQTGATAHIERVYFLGIGGIGMSGLARYFRFRGYPVEGYDRTPSAVSRSLEKEGIAVHYQDDPELIEQAYRNKENTLVVYTPAVPESNAQYTWFRQQGYTIKKRAEVLGMITESTFCLAVAGTHGKTTTTTLLAYLLKESGYAVTAFMGGVSENYNTNVLLEGQEVTVVEADEFDRSFLQLSPDIACVTSMDADHLDIYGEASALEEGFKAFTARLKPGGKILVRKGLPLGGLTYGLEEEADYCFKNIKISDSTYVCDLDMPYGKARDVVFPLPGRHNLHNALVAIAMAVEMGAPLDRLTKALPGFKGVQRRFTYHVKRSDLVYIDDYAHHPSELEAVYEAVKSFHPEQPVTAIFQPHLFSRTRDFGAEFAAALDKFDRVVLMDIYPAREEPIAGITSEWLMGQMENPNREVLSREEVLESMKDFSSGVLLTLGAGDIGELPVEIKTRLSA